VHGIIRVVAVSLILGEAISIIVEAVTGHRVAIAVLIYRVAAYFDAAPVCEGVPVVAVVSTRLNGHVGIAIHVFRVASITVLVDAVVGNLRRLRMDAGVSIVAVLASRLGRSVPVPVHVVEVRAIAILVDAVVGRLIGSRVYRGSRVVAVGWGMEAVPVLVHLFPTAGENESEDK